MHAIPSELIEPHLSKFLGLIVGEIGMEKRFPSMRKWEKWHHMMKGVGWIVSGNYDGGPNGVHARLTFSSESYKLDPFKSTYLGGSLESHFDKDEARKIWVACREALTT